MSNLVRWKRVSTVDGDYLTPDIDGNRLALGDNIQDSIVSIKSEGDSDTTYAFKFLNSSDEDLFSLDDSGRLLVKSQLRIGNDVNNRTYYSNGSINLDSTNPSFAFICVINSSVQGSFRWTESGNLTLSGSTVGNGEGVIGMKEVVVEPTTHTFPTFYIRNGKHTIRPAGSTDSLVLNDLPIYKAEAQSYTLVQRTPTTTGFGAIPEATLSVSNLKGTDLIEVDAIINISCNIVTPVKLRISHDVTPGYTYTITPPNSRTDGLDVVVPLKALYTGIGGTLNFKVDWAVVTTAGNPTIYAENKHIIVKVFQQR